jgi:hypothetical protein
MRLLVFSAACSSSAAVRGCSHAAFCVESCRR